MPFPKNVMKHLFVLSSALALCTLPVRADLAYCTATATDSSGNVQPWQCPEWSDFISESSITASGSSLNAQLDNYMLGAEVPAAGLVIQYQGELSTSSSGEFVISGGSGTGQLRGFDYSDLFAYFDNSAASEVYSSNFVYPTRGGGPVTIPFTFGVPFTLTLADT